jgi:exodeoxyribonuclease VII large subunit
LLATKTQSLRFSALALDHAGRNVVTRRFERVRVLDRRLDQRSPAARVTQWRIDLVRVNEAFVRLRERVPSLYLRRLERAEAALNSEDPTRPLERGYAIVTKDGVAVHDAASLAPGDAIAARLRRGTLDARIESVCAE